jgi:hypothetical protein
LFVSQIKQGLIHLYLFNNILIVSEMLIKAFLVLATLLLVV